jgi:hypothetical protein
VHSYLPDPLYYSKLSKVALYAFYSDANELLESFEGSVVKLTNNMKTVRHSSRRQIARPAGIAEYLWSCVLDDYLSEEEENEFSRIIGRREGTPFFCGQRNAPSIREGEDPRSVRIRGGSVSSIVAGAADGTPGVWSNDVPDVAPMVWLALPQDVTDDASELSQPIPSPHADKSGTAERKVRTMQPGNPRTRSSPREQESGPRVPRSRSLAGSGTESKTSSKAKPKSGQRIGSRGDPRNASKTISSRSQSHQEKKQRSKSVNRVRSEQRQPSKNRDRTSRSRSVSRVRSEQRQPNSSRARDVDQPRQAGRKSTRSIGSRQRSLRAPHDKEGHRRKRRDQEERSMKSSSRRSVSRDMPR